MRNVTLSVLILLVLGLLFGLTPAAQAGPPEDASGLWLYTPYATGVRQAGCNIHLDTVEDGVWTAGTFVGTSTEVGRVTIHCSGRWSFYATVFFDHVTVNGRSGTLEMTVNGSRPNASADWYGHWTITDGSGELATLRGHGTFWGPGAPGEGMQGLIYYAGRIHFEPN